MSASTRASRGPKRSLPHLPLFSAVGECPLASEPSSCHTRGTDCGGRAPKARVHQIRKRGISIISRLPMFAARPPGVHVPLDIHPSGAAGAKKVYPPHSFVAARPGAEKDAAGIVSHQPVHPSPAQEAKSIHRTHSLTHESLLPIAARSSALPPTPAAPSSPAPARLPPAPPASACSAAAAATLARRRREGVHRARVVVVQVRVVVDRTSRRA